MVEECTTTIYTVLLLLGTLLQNLTPTSAQSNCYFGGETYLSENEYFVGGTSQNDGCALLQCYNGEFSFLGFDYTCWMSRVWGDPQVLTYDAHSAKINKFVLITNSGLYSLSQTGNSFTPTTAVFSTFEDCIGPSCVKELFFKEGDTLIKVTPVSTIPWEVPEIEVEVQMGDGGPTVPYTVSSTPTVVETFWEFPPFEISHPVIAWKNASNTITLIGASGIMVQFTPAPMGANKITIWLWEGAKITPEIEGICGTPNGNVNDDFTTRDGTPYSPYSQYSQSGNVPQVWADSWEATTPPGAWGRKRRDIVKRDVQNNCENNSTLEESFTVLCNDTIHNLLSGNSYLIQIFIDACVFDLCYVTDPTEYLKSVVATVEHEVEIQELSTDIARPKVAPGIQLPVYNPCPGYLSSEICPELEVVSQISIDECLDTCFLRVACNAVSYFEPLELCVLQECPILILKPTSASGWTVYIIGQECEKVEEEKENNVIVQVQQRVN